MRLTFDPSSVDDYRRFLAVKSLPLYRCSGRGAWFPDEYAARLHVEATPAADGPIYQPHESLFDYQAGIAARAIAKRKFAGFVRPGLGKTLIEGEFARQGLASLPAGRCGLIVTPLMVVPQMMDEFARFYGDRLPVEQVAARDLSSWLAAGSSRLGLTNWEAIRDDVEPGRLGLIVADESSVMKSAYGRWGQNLIRLGRGLDWKFAGTGTPAPNDRIEYAGHAVFLDQFPTVNSFLSRFFVNRGQTDNRWELKPHALRPFYRALSHWSIFLQNPATYGWRDNAGTLPPVRVHVLRVELSDEQRSLAQEATGTLYGAAGGITSRSTLARLAKGQYQGRRVDSGKPEFIRQLVGSFNGDSTIIWCHHNDEQDVLEQVFPNAGSIRGSTPIERRRQIIADFNARRVREVISKPDILGFGLNLQVANRHVFNGLRDSYEEFYQCCMRSNRVGSTVPLDVYIPVTDIERPMLETVLAKADRVQQDTEEQELLFKEELIHAAA